MVNTLIIHAIYYFISHSVQLFDHIADCIGKFVSEHDLVNHSLPLGFTFSFPCQQEGLAKARLSKWTKGFRCEGVVGEDICELLQEALKRRTVSNYDLLIINSSNIIRMVGFPHVNKIGIVVKMTTQERKKV